MTYITKDTHTITTDGLLTIKGADTSDTLFKEVSLKAESVKIYAYILCHTDISFTPLNEDALISDIVTDIIAYYNATITNTHLRAVKITGIASEHMDNASTVSVTPEQLKGTAESIVYLIGLQNDNSLTRLNSLVLCLNDLVLAMRAVKIMSVVEIYREWYSLEDVELLALFRLCDPLVQAYIKMSTIDTKDVV